VQRLIGGQNEGANLLVQMPRQRHAAAGGTRPAFRTASAARDAVRAASDAPATRTRVLKRTVQLRKRYIYVECRGESRERSRDYGKISVFTVKTNPCFKVLSVQRVLSSSRRAARQWPMCFPIRRSLPVRSEPNSTFWTDSKTGGECNLVIFRGVPI